MQCWGDSVFHFKHVYINAQSIRDVILDGV